MVSVAYRGTYAGEKIARMVALQAAGKAEAANLGTTRNDCPHASRHVYRGDKALMAANALIGALRVSLGLDTAAFENGSKKAGLLAGKLGKTLATGIAAAAAAAAAAVAAAGTGLAFFVQKADRLGEAAQQIGVTVEQLSGLAFAANETGASLEVLLEGTTNLAKSMSDALQDATGKQARAFDAIGVSVQNADGSLRNVNDVFEDIATRFSGFEDGAGKTALAMSLLGDSGERLIPLLNQGGEGIAAMKAEAEALGLIISTQTVREADALADNVSRLGQLSSGFSNLIAQRVLPSLVKLSEIMLENGIAALKWADDIGVLDVAAFLLTTTLKTLATAAIVIGALFKATGITIASVAEAFNRVAAGDFSGAVAALKNGFLDIAKTAEETVDTVKRVWDDTAAQIEVNAPRQGKQIAAPIIAAKGEAQKALKETASALADFGGFFEGQISGAFDSFVDGTFNARKALQSLAKDLAKFIANRAIRQLFTHFLGGAGGGTGSVPSAALSFGGGFAEGGIPPAGKVSIVGENGPELIQGNGRAMVSPMGSAVGAVSIVQNIDARGANANSVAALRSIAGQIERRSIEGAVRAVENKRSKTPGMLQGRK